MYTALQSLVLAAATLYFVTVSVVSLSFFRVQDTHGRWSKRLLSPAAGAAMVAVLAMLYQRPDSALLALIAGFLLYVYAATMFIWAWRMNAAQPLRFIFSASTPTHLMQIGPYAIVRHPLYSSYIAGWIASVLVTQSPVVFLLAAGFSCIYLFGAVREEKQFARTPWAEAYQAYVQSTGMIIPRFWRKPKPGAMAD
jgi:protein-S-isoprenylcysteine O-methyltransferase Ste14